MKHTAHKLLCLFLVLTMTIGLLPATMFAGAADVVVLGQGQILVDDDFANRSPNEKVTAKVAGVTYQAVMGVNAFADLVTAIPRAPDYAKIYVAAGYYDGHLTITSNIEMYGEKMNVNPNNADWTRNPQRNNPKNESVINGGIRISKSTLTKCVVNGFYFTGTAGIEENNYNGSVKGIDFSYNCFFDYTANMSGYGVMASMGTTTCFGRITYNRIESTFTGVAFQYRHLNDFLFEGNYVDVPNASRAILMYCTNGGTTSGKANVIIRNNYFNASGSMGVLQLNTDTAYEYDVSVENNKIIGTYGINFLTGNGVSTDDKKINIVGNTINTTNYSIGFTGNNGTYNAALINIKNNSCLNNCTIRNDDWVAKNGPLDYSYNYFKNKVNHTYLPKPIVYPTYTDAAMTKVAGEMLLDSVTLTGIAADGSKTAITGVTVDNENRTVTLKDTLSYKNQKVEIDAVAQKQSDSTTAVEYYADPLCTKKLTDGNVTDYLQGGDNYIFIKLITSLDNYSYKVYRVIIKRETSQDTAVYAVKNYDASISGDKIDITVPPEDVSPNILLDVAAHTTYKIYKDKALQNAINGTIVPNVSVGTSTYYVKVTAEDGETTKVYTLNLTRKAQAAAEIIEVISPEHVSYDESKAAYVGIYSNDVNVATVDIKVSQGASWKAYEDFACTKEAKVTDIPLNVGDTVLYIRVVPENKVDDDIKVYELILHRESLTSSKKIISVISTAKDSSVTNDTISIEVGSNVTEYTPGFEYVGAAWKIYKTYEEGILSDEILGKKLTGIVGGKHTYYVEVVAYDGSSKVYVLTLERENSKEANILAIGGGQETYLDRFDCIANTVVQNEGEFSPVIEVSRGANFEIKKDNQNVTLPLALRPGTTDYTIVVTAEDGVTTNSYAWSIICIGDGTAMLESGVVVNDAWTEVENAQPVYTTIDGVVYKAYYGENAFSDFGTAQDAAVSHGGIVYVAPGAKISGDIDVSEIKLYGANFNVGANDGNRYLESVIEGAVTIDGDNTTVSGFTFAEDAEIIVEGTYNNKVSNNIFANANEQAADMLVFNNTKPYSNISITGNLFDVNASDSIILVPEIDGSFIISNNAFKNAASGSAISVQSMLSGSTLEIADNTFDAVGAVAISLDDVVERDGYLYVHNNIFKNERAVTFEASLTAELFAFNFNNNNVETSKIAVWVVNAPSTFATGFTANENTFTTIDLSFMVEYAFEVDTTKLSAMDISRNYYSTAFPGNDVFEATYSYKPYYLDADKKVLSNALNPIKITANGLEFVENEYEKYAVVPAGEAEVVASFIPNEDIATGAYGTVYVGTKKNQYVSDFAMIDISSSKAKAYVTVFSHDMSESTTQEVVIYKQTANPVYNVYDELNFIIKDMNVKVVVDHTDTTWTPKLAVINGLPITLYTDEACTKAAGSTVKLTGDSTTIYGKVEGYEPVKITAYKKLSSEKAILGIKDAYTFEYTGSNTIDITIDNRLTVADLSATVSKDASYKVYVDDTLTAYVDETAVPSTVSKLYYLVTAADESAKVYEVSITRISAVDPKINSISGTSLISNKDGYVNAKVKSYNAATGFAVKLSVPAGCSYVLYADPEHEILLRNNITFFASNYVYIYATVTSPDGVVSKDYIIKLEKEAGKITFVDDIPSWAKKAVNFTKDLGIVTGEKVTGGYKLNANGTTTREMMACFLVRMMGIDATQYATVDLTKNFADAAEVSDWALNSMKAAVALDFFTGSKNGDTLTLDPKDNISREQFAIVFVKAIGAADENVKSYSLEYNDAVEIATWARDYVKIISKLGYMKGSAGKFYPKNSITRAEIIQTIYSYMK